MGDLKVKIPKTFLGRYTTYGKKSKKYCRCSSKRTTRVYNNNTKYLPEKESPSKLMSGGGDSVLQEVKNKMLDKEMVEVIKKFLRDDNGENYINLKVLVVL